ncbi:MAG: SDR family oxidoreductase [Micavibrio sp.]|nr:SDR family oxidoreductase [Micavibrio sp.]
MKKTVLITGASSGIGYAAARHFAAQGWNVAATMRDPIGCDLAGLDGVLTLPLDVQNRSSIAGAVNSTLAHFGHIDVVVNNAGYSLFGIFESLPPEKIDEQFAVNVIGVMDVTRAVLPHFRQRNAGVIINVSSRAGIVAMPLNTLYSASKFALEGFSEALFYELAGLNIAVKIIQPSGGVTATKFSERMVRDRPAEVPAAYAPFTEKAGAVYANMQASRRTAATEVADVIFTAATDGTPRLRYFTGEDIGGFVDARREKTDQHFIDFMREKFVP